MLTGRTTLSQAVTADLLERIKSGAYAPGSRFSTEKDLMVEFDVGRNVIREAIHSIVSMGLLDVRPGRGAIVTSINTENAIGPEALSTMLLDAAIDDLNDFRILIEVEAATRAAERATADDLAAMRHHLESFAEQVQLGEPATGPELAFHHAIASASANAIYPQVLDALRDKLASARALASQVDGVPARAVRDHEEIYAAIAAHDPLAARDAMRRHLNLAIEAISVARQQLADRSNR